MRSVPFEIGGKMRHIRFDYNSICDVEEITGRDFMSLGGHSGTKFALWGGLKWEHRGLTPQVVGNWIGEYLQSGGTWEELNSAIGKAIEQSGLYGTPPEDGDEGNEMAAE